MVTINYIIGKDIASEGHDCNIFGHLIYCNLVCGTVINKSCPLAFQGSYGSI